MKTVRKFSLLAVAVSMFGACSKDMTEINPIQEGEKVKASIEFTVPEMDTPVLEVAETADGVLEVKQLPETRFSGTTADNSEKAIKNLCVLQFSADGNTRLAYDYIEVNGTGAETSVSKECEIQAAAASGSKVYFVANVGNTLNSINTETEFKAAGVAVPSRLDVASKGIPMCSDVYTGAVEYGKAIPVTLNRMFAAVKFTLTNTAPTGTNDGFTAKSIKLCKVAKTAYYDKSKAASTTAGDFIDYTENFASGSTWYIPENKQADVAGTTTEQRGPSKAPACATYFDIAGTYMRDKVAYDVTYRVYLGKNNTTSFSVERNNAYTVSATVSGMNTADARIVSSSRNLSLKHGTTTKATANCYIVNRCGVTYTFDASVKGNGTTSVGTATKTVLLWEDVNGLIQGLAYNSTAKTVSFKVTTATKGAAPEGNAVIAVCDASNKVLWSWHIWSTAYNPYASYDTYKTRALTANTTNKVLATNSRQVDVMQRNLGAGSNTPNDMTAGGLLYQWGRKDPFVGANATSGTTFKTAYNASHTSLAQTWGTVLSTKPAVASAGTTAIGIYKTAVTVDEAAALPMVFFATSGDWCSAKTDNLWGQPYVSGIAEGSYPNVKADKTPNLVAKTINDPCPEGWHVAPQDTWTAFTNDGLNHDGSGSYVNASANFVVSSGNTGSWHWGYNFYYDGTAAFRPAGGASVYYPASGLRNYSSGALDLVGSNGYSWSASPYAAGSSYAGYLNFNSNGTVNPLLNYNRAYGRPVRCAREISER